MPIFELMRASILSLSILWAISCLAPADAYGEVPRLFAERRQPFTPAAWVCPGGPDAIPRQLAGVWKVSLCIDSTCAKFGHSWMRFENVATCEVHTVSRHVKGAGGIINAETGRWMYTPAPADGLQWDLDMSREHFIGTSEVYVV